MNSKQENTKNLKLRLKWLEKIKCKAFNKGNIVEDHQANTDLEVDKAMAVELMTEEKKENLGFQDDNLCRKNIRKSYFNSYFHVKTKSVNIKI